MEGQSSRLDSSHFTFTSHPIESKGDLLPEESRSEGLSPTDGSQHWSESESRHNEPFNERQTKMEKKLLAAFQGQANRMALPHPYPPSIARLADLQPISIQDLRVGENHWGTYILLRAGALPRKKNAVMTVAEDERRDAVVAQVYQQLEEDIRPCFSVVGKGDVFLVKEPFFTDIGVFHRGIQIEHLGDFVRLVDMKGRNVVDFCLQAKLQIKREFWAAIESYSAALANNPSVEETKIIRRNRALAHLQDENFEAALVDTKSLSKPPDTSEKSLSRAGKALYGLGRFDKSFDLFKLLSEKYPNNPEAAKERSRVRSRIVEQKLGSYDFKALRKEVLKNRSPFLDHATFDGPVAVKASASPSAGREKGLFTTRAVRAGELLLCEKAFSYSQGRGSGEEEEEEEDFLNEMFGVEEDPLLTPTLQKLWRNPSILADFSKLPRTLDSERQKSKKSLPVKRLLNHGDKDEESVVKEVSVQPLSVHWVDGRPVIDTFLVERILQRSAYSCPLLSKPLYGLGGRQNKQTDDCRGLWLLAHKIKHSCLANVRLSFIGDLLFVHATCDIPSNTELSMWYLPPHGVPGENYHVTIRLPLQHWGVVCKCPLCCDLQTTSRKTRKRREVLTQEFRAVVAGPLEKIDTAKAESLLQELNLTYTSPPTTVPRIPLKDLYMILAITYLTKGDSRKTVAMGLKVLESLGFVISGGHLLTLTTARQNGLLRVERWGLLTDDVINAWDHLSKVYKRGAPYLERKATDYVKLSYKMVVGEDVSFEEMFGGGVGLGRWVVDRCLKLR